jgi:anti-anti-sigma regulatory factor
MPLTVEQAQGRVPVTIIAIQGALDYSNYLEVISHAREAHAAGARHLLIDLSDVPFMGSSGLVALHSAALLMAGEAPPDPEAGWDSFHALERATSSGVQPHVKLLKPQPRVDQMLERAGMKRFFEIHTDRAQAIGSF